MEPIKPVSSNEVFLNSAEEAAARRQPDPNRGAILPFRKTDEGLEWAMPQWMVDAKNAITLPRDVLMDDYQPTGEDLANFAMTVGVGGGIGGAAKTVPEGAIDIGTFSGGKLKHFTPLYPETEIPPPEQWVPKGFHIEGSQVVSDDGTGSGPISGFLAEAFPGKFNDFTEFRSPVMDAIDHMDFPAKGSNIIKDLRDRAPTIRKSELDTYALDKIDPNKKYEKEEIEQLFSTPNWNVRNDTDMQYSQYQRQQVADPEVEYKEFPVDAMTDDHTKAFVANNQHYNPETLSHTRLSLRRTNPIVKSTPELRTAEDKLLKKVEAGEITDDQFLKGMRDLAGEEDYVLIEELQSDLVQGGWSEKKAPVKEDFFLDVMSRGNIWNEYSTEFRAKYADFADKAFDVLTKSGLKFSVEDFEAQNYLREKFPETDNTLITEVGADLSYYLSRNENKGGGKPPITSTTEGVRLGVLQAIAYAQQKGVDKVVLPPLDRILQARLGHGVDFEKNMKPGSAFYSTYINAANKVLNQLQNELGDKIKIGPREMKYKDHQPVRPPEPDGDEVDILLDDDFEITEDMLGEWVPEPEPHPPGWQEVPGDIPPERQTKRTYSNLGVEIDISGLGRLDASKPRFAEGGLISTEEGWKLHG